jgi:hypothetical protein
MFEYQLELSCVITLLLFITLQMEKTAKSMAELEIDMNVACLNIN